MVAQNKATGFAVPNSQITPYFGNVSSAAGMTSPFVAPSTGAVAANQLISLSPSPALFTTQNPMVQQPAQQLHYVPNLQAVSQGSLTPMVALAASPAMAAQGQVQQQTHHQAIQHIYFAPSAGSGAAAVPYRAPSAVLPQLSIGQQQGQALQQQAALAAQMNAAAVAGQQQQLAFGQMVSAQQVPRAFLAAQASPGAQLANVQTSVQTNQQTLQQQHLVVQSGQYALSSPAGATTAVYASSATHAGTIFNNQSTGQTFMIPFGQSLTQKAPPALPNIPTANNGSTHPAVVVVSSQSGSILLSNSTAATVTSSTPVSTSVSSSLATTPVSQPTTLNTTVRLSVPTKPSTVLTPATPPIASAKNALVLPAKSVEDLPAPVSAPTSSSRGCRMITPAVSAISTSLTSKSVVIVTTTPSSVATVALPNTASPATVVRTSTESSTVPVVNKFPVSSGAPTVTITSVVSSAHSVLPSAETSTNGDKVRNNVSGIQDDNTEPLAAVAPPVDKHPANLVASITSDSGAMNIPCKSHPAISPPTTLEVEKSAVPVTTANSAGSTPISESDPCSVSSDAGQPLASAAESSTHPIMSTPPVLVKQNAATVVDHDVGHADSMPSFPPVLQSETTDARKRQVRDEDDDKQRQKAVVKPSCVITHVIDGFVIKESSVPFPVHCERERRPLTRTEKKVAKLSGKAASASENSSNHHTSEVPKSHMDNGSLVNGSRAARTSAQSNNSLPVENEIKSAPKRAEIAIKKSPATTAAAAIAIDPGANQSTASAPATPTIESPNNSNPLKWSVDEVRTFVTGLSGCAEYAADFCDQEVDGQALMLLTADHLMAAMSIKLGPALKICSAVDKMRSQFGIHVVNSSSAIDSG